MNIRGKPLRHIFPFQVESATGSLYGLTDGAVSVLSIDGIDGLHQRFLLASVDRVEEVLLARTVGRDLPQDDACFLEIKSHSWSVGSAVSHWFGISGSEDSECGAHDFILSIGGDGQGKGIVDSVFRHVFVES